MVLTAIRIGTDSQGNHSYARTPYEQLCALRAAWGPVFAEYPVDTARGDFS